jgi:L-2-hydroxyglutarate oxidase LhgO
MADVDVAIIGAGVIGLACAERLARDGMNAVVIEEASTFGTHTSSRSSEVVHAGMYYPPGSSKALLCRQGAAALYAWCEAHFVACPRVGKFIVATSADEQPSLHELLQRGRDNGVPGLALVSQERLAREEPEVLATEALWSPETGIVDSHGFMASLRAAAASHGCEFAWKHRVHAVARVGSAYRLTVLDPSGSSEQLDAARVVNAAGLKADAIAAAVGLDVDTLGYRQTYVKGTYFQLSGAPLARHLIYPIPPRSMMGLGTHLTVGLDGSNRFGPDTEVLPDRIIDYRLDESRRAAFVAAAARYLRRLDPSRLEPAYAGVRPKLMSPGAPRDFVISEESAHGLASWVNLLGIESPGLTSSLAIAEKVTALLAQTSS